MKIIMEREPLLAALSFVAKWSAKADFIAVLSHLMIEARDGSVTITGTNLDKVARTSVPADIEEDGATCIPAELLVKAIKGAASTEVSITTDEKGAVIKIGRARLSVRTLPSDQFPDAVMLSAAPKYRLTMPAAALASRLDMCAPFVWTEAGRDFISGVSWRHAGTGLELCGTDGKALSFVETGERYGDLDDLDIIVPPIDLPQWSGDVDIEVSDFFIRFRCGDDALASKLIEGNFPDVHRLIIQQAENVALAFDRAALATAVGIVDLNATGNENSILFVGRDHKCTLSTRSEKGEIEDVVDYEGPDFVVAIASKVIGKILDSIESEMIEIAYADHMTPVIVRPLGTAGRIMLAVPYRDSRLVDCVPKTSEAA